MQRKGINFKWPGVVFGEHTAAEKLRVFVSNLSGGGGGRKGGKLEQLSGEQIPPIAEKFSKRKLPRRDGVSSLLHSGVNLLGSLPQSHLPPPNPPTGPRQGAFNGAAGEVGPQRSGELNDDRMGMISHVSRRGFFYFL